MSLIKGDRITEVLRMAQCNLSPLRLAHRKHPEDSDKRRHFSVRVGEREREEVKEGVARRGKEREGEKGGRGRRDGCF